MSPVALVYARADLITREQSIRVVSIIFAALAALRVARLTVFALDPSRTSAAVYPFFLRGPVRPDLSRQRFASRSSCMRMCAASAVVLASAIARSKAVRASASRPS